MQIDKPDPDTVRPQRFAQYPKHRKPVTIVGDDFAGFGDGVCMLMGECASEEWILYDGELMDRDDHEHES